MTDRPVIIVMKGMDRTDAILNAWASWRRQGEHHKLGVQSWLGRLVKQAKLARGEEKIEPSTMPHYDDELMMMVAKQVEALPPVSGDPRRIRQCVREHFCGPGWWTSDRKAKRCKVSRRTFYRNVATGKELIDAAIEWSAIMVVDQGRSAELKEQLMQTGGY